MTSTAPLYAPIKRVSIPAVALALKLQDQKLSTKLALANINLHTTSGQVITVEKPYIQVKTFLTNNWRTIENVDLEIERVSIDTKIFDHFETILSILHQPKQQFARKHLLTIKSL